MKTANLEMTSLIIFALFLIGGAVGTEEEFFYDAQDEWGGICVTGNTMRQSPIDIKTEDVEEDEDEILIDLSLSSDWATAYDGDFVHTGHSAQFNPDFTGVTGPTTTNHLGTYDLLQCHFHWGEKAGEGSEHLVDGCAGELEVHFVHRMQGATDPSAEDFLMVIGVFADVDEDAPLTGPWLQLDVTAIQDFEETTPITGYRFDQLLPKNLDYYFYEGSLTTPPCNETVGWFVLKDRITVPGAYLEELRKMEENEEGDLLEFNFRMPQELAGRTVLCHEGDEGDDTDDSS